MKKSIIFIAIVMIILSCITVSARNVGPKQEVKQTQFESKARYNSTVPGLENAILNAKDEEKKSHLISVLEKIEAKRLEQLTKLQNLEIVEDEDGNITASGKEDKKFLGLFKVKRNAKFVVGEDGNIYKIKRGLDFLFKEI